MFGGHAWGLVLLLLLAWLGRVAIDAANLSR
jgi:hypothetical protein